MPTVNEGIILLVNIARIITTKGISIDIIPELMIKTSLILVVLFLGF
jgi:hypothetical protein